MGLFSQTIATDALEDLLDRERAAALSGRFDVLERLSAEKERIVLAVARDGAAPEALVRLKEGSERNGRLLDAMRVGLMAARTRLDALKGRAANLQTYDAEGRMQSIKLSGRPTDRRL